MLLLVNDQQPYKTLKDFIDDAKKRPDAIIFSSGGLYGATHLPVALLEKAAGGLKLRHLPTNGGGPAITALLGNNAQMSTQIVSASLPHIKAGKLRPLASFGAQALASAARRADAERARLRRRILPVGRHFRAEGHALQHCCDVERSDRQGRGLRRVQDRHEQCRAKLDYLDAAGFAKFWDKTANASDEAVKLIGRVQG